MLALLLVLVLWSAVSVVTVLGLGVLFAGADAWERKAARRAALDVSPVLPLAS